MADSAFTTLLENIEVNLRDTTRHSALSGLKNNANYGKRYITAAFVPLDHSPPYATITPGAAGKSGADQRVDLQQVEIHLVHGIFNDPNDYYTVLGTSSLQGQLTLIEDIEAALVRSRPYNDGTHVTANGYTTQTGILTGYALGWTKPQPADVETPELYLVQTLTMEYRIPKGT